MKRIVLTLLLVVGISVPIAPSAFAADTQAPVLVDWKLIDLKTDISTGDGLLRIQFSVSDESIIVDPLSSLSSQTTTQQSGFAFPILVSKIGNISTYSAEGRISFGKAPGLWRWLLFPLRDNLGNSGSFGPGGSWPVDIWVYDKDFTEAKRLAAEAVTAKAAAEAKAIADKAAAEAKAIADKAAAEAKAIADKAAANANRKEQIIKVSPLITGSVSVSSNGLPIQVKSTSNLSVFAYNSTDNVCVYENGIIRAKTSGRCVIAFSQEGDSEYKPANNLILDFAIASTNNKTTITCVKGKLTKKVTAVKAKCPAGYKVKK